MAHFKCQLPAENKDYDVHNKPSVSFNYNS